MVQGRKHILQPRQHPHIQFLSLCTLRNPSSWASRQKRGRETSFSHGDGANTTAELSDHRKQKQKTLVTPGHHHCTDTEGREENWVCSGVPPPRLGDLSWGSGGVLCSTPGLGPARYQKEPLPLVGTTQNVPKCCQELLGLRTSAGDVV